MRKASLVADVVMLVVYAIVSLPSVTGVAVHEWLSLGVVAFLLVHASRRLGRVLPAKTAEGRAPLSAGHKGRLVLDMLLLVALAVTAVSGVMISGAVLPSFGLYMQGYHFWDPLHAVSAKVLLALLLVHFALNATLLASGFKSKEQK